MEPQRPVMDVQRPRPQPVGPPQPPLPPTAPADNITAMSPAPGQVIGEQPPHMPTPDLPAMAPPPKKKRTGLIVAIVTLVVVLLVGAGAGGFIWYKSRQKAQTEPVTTTTTTDRVTVEEIDSTTSSIDKTMNTLNDSSDITPNDVTDSALGL